MPATDIEVVAPSLEEGESTSSITLDAANVLHNAERDARHKLAHLEEEFLAEWDKLFTGMHNSEKKLLKFTADRV